MMEFITGLLIGGVVGALTVCLIVINDGDGD